MEAAKPKIGTSRNPSAQSNQSLAEAWHLDDRARLHQTLELVSQLLGKVQISNKHACLNIPRLRALSEVCRRYKGHFVIYHHTLGVPGSPHSIVQSQ